MRLIVLTCRIDAKRMLYVADAYFSELYAWEQAACLMSNLAELGESVAPFGDGRAVKFTIYDMAMSLEDGADAADELFATMRAGQLLCKFKNKWMNEGELKAAIEAEQKKGGK